MKPETMREQNASQLNAIAAELASAIDEHAGDYPLVSIQDDTSVSRLIWGYSNFVVEVSCDSVQPTSIRSRELARISVGVLNVQEGMELLRRTEALRQKRERPYIQLL